MMKTKAVLLTISLIFLLNAARAQQADSLIGKWVFYDLYNTANLDSFKIKTLKKMFKSISFYFNDKKQYKNTLMDLVEEGTWSFDEKAGKITMTANKGTIKDMTVLQLSGGKLTVSMDELSFVLTKAAAGEKDIMAAAPPTPSAVSTTAAAIAKKWYFKKREMPNRTPEQIKTISEMMAGTYLQLKASGDYETVVLQLKEEGKWFFGADNKSIILSAENEKKVWYISSITTTTLVLLKGNTAETWYFSTEQ